MPIIHVIKQFTLHHKVTDAAGTQTELKEVFPVGAHEVSDDVAQHWYVRAHTDEGQGETEEAAADRARRLSGPQTIVRTPIGAAPEADVDAAGEPAAPKASAGQKDKAAQA